jgi:AraC-like DNA-binding protein
VTAHRLDRLILFDRRLKGVGHARSRPRLANDAFSHFVIHLVVEGELLGGEDSRFTRAGPGDIVLQDLRQPTENRILAARIITVSVARDLIEAAAGTSNGLHGRVLPPTRSGLLGDYLQSLIRRADDLAHDDLPGLSRTFVNLLGLAIAPTGAGPTASRRLGEIARREAIRRVIEQRLTDPTLGAAHLIPATNISRATLYRLLKPYGGVDSFITDRRLDAVRGALTDRADSRSLEDLARRYHFRDSADLRARFRTRFGITPTAYRQMIDDPTRKLEAIKRQWASWMVEVR